MEITLLLGLYIFKGEDPYSDNLFKSIYQLCVDKNDNLYMQVIDGPLVGMRLNDVTYETLERNFISLSKFFDEATFEGQNVVRIPELVDDTLDLNFTGYINEKNRQFTNPESLLTHKKQVILYVGNNNILMYYDENSNDFEDENLMKGFYFLNSDYINSNWMALQDCSDLFGTKEEIMMYFYDFDEIKSKRMILK